MGHSRREKRLCDPRGRPRRADLVLEPGGDEFVIVALGHLPGARAPALADAVLVALGRPYAIDRFVAYTRASIGVVVAPHDGNTVEALRQGADLALYRAKANGRGSVCFFSGALDGEQAERRALERDPRVAIERDETGIAYQPIVAEGVETNTQVQALVEMGCTHLQGYLFSEPKPEEAFTHILGRSPSMIGMEAADTLPLRERVAP